MKMIRKYSYRSILKRNNPQLFFCKDCSDFNIHEDDSKHKFLPTIEEEDENHLINCFSFLKKFKIIINY